MSQKLSAMRYIKNNKRRVSVLIVSLVLCFVLTYISQFLLSTTTETFRVILVSGAKKLQYVQPSDSLLGLEGYDLSDEEYLTQYNLKVTELMDKLLDEKGIYNVFLTETVFTKISCIVGQYYFEIPLANKAEMEAMLNHMNARLSSGRLPEKNYEIVLSEDAMKNADYQVGDYLKEDSRVKIVGALKCEYYFGCGIYEGEAYVNKNICILSDGSIEDFTLLLTDMGYKFDKNEESIIDKASGEADLKETVEDEMEKATNVIYVVILVMVFVVLFIVYTTYLRDRKNEWCLYSSIGYSKRTIYFSVIRELLFTFAVSLLAGGIIIFLMEIALDYSMIRPMGNRCRYFYPDVLMEILCSYALLFGILQIPVRYELFKIKTIDSMDDDLN